jgi:hypothetical protein
MLPYSIEIKHVKIKLQNKFPKVGFFISLKNAECQSFRMTQSPLMDYVGRYLDGELKKESEKRAGSIGSRMRIVDEAYVPIYPRSLWIGARLNFVLQEDVACISLCSAALEASLKDFLGKYFRCKLNVDFDLALDEMEIRHLVPVCQSLKLIDEKTNNLIWKINGNRNIFVHSKIRKITEEAKKGLGLDKDGEVEWQKLDPTIQQMYVAGSAGEDKAPETLEWLEKLFKALFQDSEYHKWSQPAPVSVSQSSQ